MIGFERNITGKDNISACYFRQELGVPKYDFLFYKYPKTA